jgi:murein DD-endopeptidase MepM/ murein hydrolase activator NlpD
MEAKVAAAERAEQELRERLERERRQREEIEAALRRARAKASSGGGGGGGGVLPRPANNTVISGFTCPVPGSSFGDSWGAPRSGGRRHQGVDMMAGYGTPIYAVVSGSVRHSTSGLGGNQIWLSGNDGNTYFYAHIQSYVGGPGAVSAGDQIATVGDTGNARGTPHLHFEIHPGGGAAVNPYPTVRAAC